MTNTPPPKSRVVLVDGSEHAHWAFEQAAADTAPDDKLFVVHSCRYLEGSFVVPPDMRYMQSMPSLVEEHRRIMTERGRQVCQKYHDECKTKKVPQFETVNLTSGDKEEVCRFAELQGADTIYVGPRGLSPAQKFFLGSFSTFVINHCKANVMLVKNSPPP
eukprot:c6725_g1_i1.p1 GENE.c6725_g1_i1~~c6725_g1_i1.p1  ORF type:complete len:188 (+),score=37.21 c6725_g1_i1:82-564(+)